MIHHTGKKGCAVVNEEVKEKLGHSPTHMEMFITCYSKKDGKPANEASRKAIEDMKKLVAQAPAGSHDSPSQDDIFSKVMGKEKNGRARLYGLGVCPSDIWGAIPSRAASHRMAMEWKTSLDKVVEQYDELRNQFQEMRSLVMQGGQQANSPSDPSSAPATSSQQHMSTSSSTFQRQPIQDGATVSLKILNGPTQTVAKGIFYSRDASTQVGGGELGRNWCEVQVQVAVNWDEELIRPYGLLQTIGDALGAPVAWPLSLVVQHEE